MAGLENLFVTNPSLPQVQTTKLPDDSATWTEVLTTKLRELYPAVAPLPIKVEFQKKDEQMGTAVGALHVMSEDMKKVVLVPFIVKKFELCPMDVWLEAQNQAVHPLSNDTFKKEFFVTSPAQGLDARPADAAGNYFNDPSTWSTNYPPLQGRYSYASAGYPLLDMISDTLHEADLETFRNELRAQPTLLLAFQKHGHQELITKLAKKKGKTPYGAEHRDKPVGVNDFAASAVKLIPTGVLSLKREGPDKYSLLSTADQMFDLLASEHLNGDDCKAMLSKITGKPWDSMHDVDQSGEKLLSVGKAPEKGVWLYDDLALGKEKPEAANDFAHYRVKTQDGVQLEGLVIPHVVSFQGKKMGYKLFLSAGHSSMQTSIAGVKQLDGAARSALLEKLDGAARTGQTGTFVFVDDGKAIATEPVTIKAIEVYGPITAIRMDGTKIKISRGYAQATSGPSVPSGSKGKKAPKVLDVHGMIEQRPNEFVIDRKMVWIPMERFTDVTSSPAEWMDKEAASHMTLDPLVIRYTGIVYETQCAGEEKLALDARRLGMLLAAKGTPVEKIAGIIKKADIAGRVKVYGLRPLRKKADIVKEAGVTEALLEKISTVLKRNLIKVAAEIDQSATVDALLALNFLNGENLSKFVAYRQVFEKITDYLAELTLASRLGMKDIPESAPVIAIHKLQEIIEGLKKVEAGLKKPEAKTS